MSLTFRRKKQKDHDYQMIQDIKLRVSLILNTRVFQMYFQQSHHKTDGNVDIHDIQMENVMVKEDV